MLSLTMCWRPVQCKSTKQRVSTNKWSSSGSLYIMKVPCSSAHHEGIWRNGSTAALTLNLTRRWVEWRVSLHGTKAPRHLLNWRLGGPQNLSGRFGQQMYLLFLTGNRNTVVLTVSTYPGHRTDWPSVVVLLSALLCVRFVATGLRDRDESH
jgi:hypothetical protein